MMPGRAPVLFVAACPAKSSRHVGQNMRVAVTWPGKQFSSDCERISRRTGCTHSDLTPFLSIPFFPFIDNYADNRVVNDRPNEPIDQKY